MKNSIKLSALVLLLSAGIFTSTAASAKTGGTKKADEMITVSAMKHGRGVSVNIVKAEASKSYVTIYDASDNILFEDFLPSQTDVTKGYIFSELGDGDYTIKVKSDDTVVTKNVHIYEEERKKTFFFVD